MAQTTVAVKTPEEGLRLNMPSGKLRSGLHGLLELIPNAPKAITAHPPHNQETHVDQVPLDS